MLGREMTDTAIGHFGDDTLSGGQWRDTLYVDSVLDCWI